MLFFKSKPTSPLKKPLGKKARVLLWGIIIIAVLAYNLSPIAARAWFGSLLGGLGALYGLFSMIMALVIFLLGYALGLVLALIVDVSNMEIDVNEPFIRLGWTIIRDITNYFFIIVLMIIAFATILKIESYNYKKFLPRLVAMAILVNFSPYICQFFIDLAQTVMMPFVHAFAPAGPGNIVNAFGLHKIFTTSFSNALFTGQKMIWSWLPGESAIGYLFIFLKMIMVVVVLAIIGFILSARVVIIWILAILSPVAFVFMVIPATQRYAQQWWSHFGKTLIIGPVIAFFFWLTLTLPQIGFAPSEMSSDNAGQTSSASANIQKVQGQKLTEEESKEKTELEGKLGGTFCDATEACDVEFLLRSIFMVVFLLVGAIIAGQIGAHGGSMLGNFANKWMSRPGAFFKGIEGRAKGLGMKGGKGLTGLWWEGTKLGMAENKVIGKFMPSVWKEALKKRREELKHTILGERVSEAEQKLSEWWGKIPALQEDMHRNHEFSRVRSKYIEAGKTNSNQLVPELVEVLENKSLSSDEKEKYIVAIGTILEETSADGNIITFIPQIAELLGEEKGGNRGGGDAMQNFLATVFPKDSKRQGRIWNRFHHQYLSKGHATFANRGKYDEETGEVGVASVEDAAEVTMGQYSKFSARERMTLLTRAENFFAPLKRGEKDYTFDPEMEITGKKMLEGLTDDEITALITRPESRSEFIPKMNKKYKSNRYEKIYDKKTGLTTFKKQEEVEFTPVEEFEKFGKELKKSKDKEEQKQGERILRFCRVIRAKSEGSYSIEELMNIAKGVAPTTGTTPPPTSSSPLPLTFNPEAYERTKKLRDKANNEYGSEEYYTEMREYIDAKPGEYLTPGGMEAAEKVLGRRDAEAREKEGKEPLKPAFSVNSLARALAEGQAPGPASMAMDFELLKDLEFMKGREGTQELTWESLSGEQGEQLVKKIESILLKKLNELKAKKEGTPAEAAKAESKREELQGAEAELAKLEKSLAEAVLPAEKSLRTEAVDKQKEKVGKLKNELTGLESGVVAPQELNAEETKQFESIETILGSNLLHNRDKLSALSIINTGGGREAIAHGRGHQIATQLDPAGEKQIAMWRGLSDEERQRRKEKIERETGREYDEMGLAKENFAIMYANETSVRDKSPEAIKFSGLQKKELVDLAEEKGIPLGMAVGTGEIDLADVQKEKRRDKDGKETKIDVHGRMQERWWKDLSDGEKARRHKMIEKRVGYELTLDPKNKEHQNVLARENAAMMYENEGPDGDKSPNAVRFNDAQRLELQRKAKESGVTLSIPVEIAPEAAIGEIPSKWRAGLTHLKQGLQEKLRLRKKEAETSGQPAEELSLQEELEQRQAQYDQDIKERTKEGKVLEGEIKKKPDIIKQKVEDHKKAKGERITAEEELATAQVAKKETAEKIQEHLGLAKKAESAGNRSAAKTHYDEARKLKKTHDEQTKVVEEKEKTVVEKQEKEKQASQAVTEEIRTTEQTKEKAEKNEKIVNLTKEMKELEGLKLKYLSLSPEDIEAEFKKMPTESLKNMDAKALEEQIKNLQQQLRINASMPGRGLPSKLEEELKGDIELMQLPTLEKTMQSKGGELAELKAEKKEDKKTVEAPKVAEAPAAKGPAEPREAKEAGEVGEMPEAPEDMADPEKRDKYLGSLGAAIDRLNQAIRSSSLDDAGITTAVDSLKSKFDDLSDKMSKMPNEFGKLSGSLKQAINNDPYGGSIFDRRAGPLAKEENIRLAYFMGQLLKILKKDLEKDKGRPKSGG